MAVISLDFASVATCPSTPRLVPAQAQALTRCGAPRPYGAVVRAAQRLAVHGEDLPGDRRANRFHPGAKAGFEGPQRQHRGDGDHYHLDGLVASPQRIARVFPHCKMPDKRPVAAQFIRLRFST